MRRKRMKEIDTVCAADMLPVRAHEADAGADLKAARDVAIRRGDTAKVSYGSYEYCTHCRRKVDRCEGMDMEKEKKTAMISQPMRGKTDEEILDVRNRIAAKLKASGCEVVDTVFHVASPSSATGIARDAARAGSAPYC